MPQLSRWSAELKAIATNADNLREERHDAVHSCVINRVGEGMRTFRILYEKTFHTKSERQITVSDLSSLTDTILDKAGDAIALAEALSSTGEAVNQSVS